MKTALVSVSDKTGLADFINKLKSYEELRLLATSSTAAYLTEHNLDVISVESVTSFPEILGGRVKTLHPRVFAGILARPSKDDRDCLADHKIDEIDFVIVNLYPFEKKLTQGLSEAEMVEQIDIGGVSLLRAAAKNFERVVVVSEPSQYQSILDNLAKSGGKTDREMRKKLAVDALRRTASYDQAINTYLASTLEKSTCSGDAGAATCADEDKPLGNLPSALSLNLVEYQKLRYGENPHQAASWFHPTSQNVNLQFPPFAQLNGKELSANNIVDIYSLLKILRDIGGPGVCIIKHNNPCGVSLGKDLHEAYDRAYATDPLSAFGGIYGFTGEVDEAMAKKINEGFVEVVAAPSYSAAALEILKTKKNLRILKLQDYILKPAPEARLRLKDLELMGVIVEQDMEPSKDAEQFEVVTGKLDKAALADVAFTWNVCRHLTSNAIFVARDGLGLGFGIGQTSRVASTKIALAQAGAKAKGAVLASDAFFPNIDNIEEAAAAGIGIIVQPGGSIKDKDVIAACEKHGITMLFTGQRCFKH
ncbi:MAG: bifunctional phosphoribosylaminoimidazolecarboxamide formyltransferase/IMP cyclohydrolase [Cyanobacteria bacterium SZAS LIN-3]|nr:bifunctional phosphoribosylaminoimidazolecarboxamide formyltransferase/IMP cyclohydrolase [Cyanobacteria bacterium SZAS LIN-3]